MIDVRPENIWGYDQIKPTQVARDLEQVAGVPRDTTYKVLLARGVFKWLSVRRRLIKLKNSWKAEVVASLDRQREANWRTRRRTREWERGFRAGIEQCRAEVRVLCHSERWQAPDNDAEARQWLAKEARDEAL